MLTHSMACVINYHLFKIADNNRRLKKDEKKYFDFPIYMHVENPV